MAGSGGLVTAAPGTTTDILQSSVALSILTLLCNIWKVCWIFLVVFLCVMAFLNSTKLLCNSGASSVYKRLINMVIRRNIHVFCAY